MLRLIDCRTLGEANENSELAIIPGGLRKELQLLDIGGNGTFKVKLRGSWERWVRDGAHTLTKTGRQRRASFAPMCEWIVGAWAKLSALTAVRALAKAGIVAQQPPGNEADSDNDEREPGLSDGGIAQLFNSDTENENFDGFVQKD